MKEEELDQFVGKDVMITDFENEKNFGRLYKIINFKVKISKNNEELHAINKGYYLKGKQRGIDYRKSHIKKIRSVYLGENNG